MSRESISKETQIRCWGAHHSCESFRGRLKGRYPTSLPGSPFNALQIRRQVLSVQAKAVSPASVPVERHTVATVPVIVYYCRLVICHSGLHHLTRLCILVSQMRPPKIFSPGIPGSKSPKILYIPSECDIKTSCFSMSPITIKSTSGEKRPRMGFQNTAVKLVHLHLLYQ